MNIVGRSWCHVVGALGLALLLMAGRTCLAQAPAPAPARPVLAPLLTLAEARIIIEGAIAFARQENLRAAVVVVDTSGNLISADSMDGVRFNDLKGAEGKAFAAAIFRDTTEVLSELAKTRPDRYYGIINLYPGKVYLVGGGSRSLSTASWSGRSASPACRNSSTRRPHEPASRRGLNRGRL